MLKTAIIKENKPIFLQQSISKTFSKKTTKKSEKRF